MVAMKALLLFCCISFLVNSIKGTDNCPQLKKIGCFNSRDAKSNARLLPNLVFSDRGGIDWNNWNNYLADLACRCAKGVGEGNGEIRTFGLEFYGECWKSSSAVKLESFQASDKCWGPEYQKCNVTNNEYCTGEADTIAVYQFGFCLFNPDGIYTDPNSCAGFLQCYNKNQMKHTCPSGTLYNEEKKYCDYPSNVDCGSRPK